ncbi:hypothetical protein ACWERW_40645 [Streptomyces sp. NPDC004012]
MSQNDVYAEGAALAQRSAASAAATRTAAPPVSVRKKSRSGERDPLLHSVWPV